MVDDLTPYQRLREDWDERSTAEPRSWLALRRQLYEEIQKGTFAENGIFWDDYPFLLASFFEQRKNGMLEWSEIVSSSDRHAFMEQLLLVRSHSPIINSLFGDGLLDALLFSSFAEKMPSDSTKDFLLSRACRMVSISSGTFSMGAPQSESASYGDEKPRHSVELSRGLAVGVYPVNQLFWGEIMGGNPSSAKGIMKPVESVSWFDAIFFCNRLSEREHKRSYYRIAAHGEVGHPNLVERIPSSNGYRLLTEAEWEYCARAGQDTTYAGSDVLDDVAWHNGNSKASLQPIGQKNPNAWGLFDMSGNVWEWVCDALRVYTSVPCTDPIAKKAGGGRGHRGGSFAHDQDGARVSFRGRSLASRKASSLGFRIALNTPLKQDSLADLRKLLRTAVKD